MSNRSRSPDHTEEARWARLDTRQTKSTRTTCDLCQKRKVRCDRTKPRCIRCLRGGQICTYPIDETSRINTEIQTLQSRLGLAEEKLAEHGLSLQSDSAATPVPNPPGSDPSFMRPISHQPLHNVVPKHTTFPNTNERPDGDFHFDFNDWNSTAVFDIFHQDGAEMSHPAPELDYLDRSQNAETAHSGSHAHNTPHAMQRCSPVETGQSEQDLTNDLSQMYFHSVQPHFPLLCQSDFSRLSTFDNPAVVALKSAVCMAGAQMTPDASLGRRFYLKSRAYLEMAELHDDTSRFATLESAQTLLLLARHELTHGAFQRALMTMARLAQLLLILYPHAPVCDDYRKSGNASSLVDHSSTTAVEPLIEIPHHERSKRKLILLTFSLYFIMPHGLIYEVLFTNHSFDPDLFSKCVISRETLDRNPCPKGTDGDDIEDIELLFFVSKLYAAVRRHHNNTKAIIEGTATLDYNICLTHENLEVQIDTLLAMVSPTLSDEAPHDYQQQQSQNNFRVLALLIALGARILLYMTAPITAKKAGFLRAVVPECRKIAVIAANDFCANLSQSGLLRTDRATDFRELRIFLMPVLVLVAEAQLSILEEEENQEGHNFYVIGSETKRYLEMILGVMELWKGDATVYASCVAKCRSFLDRRQNNLKSRRGRNYI
ncbi:hypothetical protein F5Y19DRAFT_458378 [Xylariaceae sp. FL1651]|nr:hypothetical protein F5Y19DRAFT_458378 [Xylariaceae sp. FL1651]